MFYACHMTKTNTGNAIGSLMLTHAYPINNLMSHIHFASYLASAVSCLKSFKTSITSSNTCMDACTYIQCDGTQQSRIGNIAGHQVQSNSYKLLFCNTHCLYCQFSMPPIYCDCSSKTYSRGKQALAHRILAKYFFALNVPQL